MVPQKVQKEDLYAMFRKLNCGQRKIVMHVLQSIRANQSPLRIFISGSAGLGKSTIYQSVTYVMNQTPGGNLDSIKVLLCAPSGKAAFLINGATLHTDFALPVTQFGGQMPNFLVTLRTAYERG